LIALLQPSVALVFERGEPPINVESAEIGAVLVATGLALAPVAAELARRIFPGRNVFFARWGFSHVALVGVLGLVLMLGAGWALGSRGALEAPSPLRDLELSAAILGACCAAVAVIASRLDPSGVRCLGLWPGRQVRAAAAGLACYLVLLPALLGIGLAWPWLLSRLGVGYEPQLVLEQMKVIAPGERPLAILLGVLVMPLFEETLFRGFLQPLLVQNLSDKLGVVATSVVFAALHGSGAFLPIFALSLVLGGTMLRTQRLFAAWTVHAVHNGLMFLVLYSMPPGPLSPESNPAYGAGDGPARAVSYAARVTMFPRKGLIRRVDGGAFVASNAVVTGDVTLGEDVGIWFGCVVRGDDAPLSVGRRTNVQDLTMIHADTGVPNVIGEEVTIGHRCVLHGAKIEDRCLIGMGAILLGGSVIGAESLIAAGAVVREGFVVPPRSLVAGVPGKILRALTDEEAKQIRRSADGYVKKIRLYLDGREA
jgi:carbonic anhydrase/acetyltransferase-like protein (isoleucine patch superfamily)/membrane protease YdiL (CAAX protease family)